MNGIEDNPSSILFEPHLIPALIGLLGLVAVKPVATIKSVPFSAILVISPVYKSRGKSIITTNKLKKSCIVEAAKALLNSCSLLTCPKETKVLVTVVPIFAPITIGIAYSKLRTPLPTKPTIVAVVTEEDCTKTVHKIPTNKPAKGLDTDSKSASVYSAPKVLIPFSRSLIDTRTVSYTHLRAHETDS